MITVSDHYRRTSAPKTPASQAGSRFVFGLAAFVLSAACGTTGEANPAPPSTAKQPVPATHGVSKDPDAQPEVCLGVHDNGIWSDLDDKVQLALPKDLAKERVSARIDRDKKLLLLS